MDRLEATKMSKFVAGGCLNFGHSCFGGMGKRTPYPLNYEVLQDDTSFPEDQKIPYDSAQYYQLQQRQYLPRIIKQWLLNYRRVQGLPKE